MDFGSSDFKTSVGWLMPRYAALGVELEEIWGYELREMDLNKYWRSVPGHAKTRLHVSAGWAVVPPRGAGPG